MPSPRLGLGDSDIAEDRASLRSLPPLAALLVGRLGDPRSYTNTCGRRIIPLYPTRSQPSRWHYCRIKGLAHAVHISRHPRPRLGRAPSFFGGGYAAAARVFRHPQATFLNGMAIGITTFYLALPTTFSPTAVYDNGNFIAFIRGGYPGAPSEYLVQTWFYFALPLALILTPAPLFQANSGLGEGKPRIHRSQKA